MALEPIAGFRPLQTHHCITGSLRHVYEFHGYPISEDLLLGLGAGLGFIYWHMKGTLPMCGGRANAGRPGEEGLEIASGRRLGVAVECHRTGSAHKAQQALLDLLAAGEPVMLQVDMGYLPYFDFPEEYHFGGHAIVAAGYEAESGQVLVADREGVLYPVSLADLAKARGSQYQPFPPQHGWYTFDFSRKQAPEPGDVWQAIDQVTAGMLQPPIANLGVKGILTAAKRIRDWPKVMEAEGIHQACFNLFIFIDATGGTGGGLFRYMYGRFLDEAAQLTGESRLAEVGAELKAIGDRWQGVAELARAASQGPDAASCLPEISAQIKAIAGPEQQAWERLHAIAADRA